LESEENNSTWRDLRKLFDVAAADKAAKSSQKLNRALHSLQIRNELLNTENQGLRTSLEAKKHRKTKGKVLDLHGPYRERGDAMFWSPKKVREANLREEEQQRDTEEEQL